MNQPIAESSFQNERGIMITKLSPKQESSRVSSSTQNSFYNEKISNSKDEDNENTLSTFSLVGISAIPYICKTFIYIYCFVASLLYKYYSFTFFPTEDEK